MIKQKALTYIYVVKRWLGEYIEETLNVVGLGNLYGDHYSVGFLQDFYK